MYEVEIVIKFKIISKLKRKIIFFGGKEQIQTELKIKYAYRAYYRLYPIGSKGLNSKD